MREVELLPEITPDVTWVETQFPGEGYMLTDVAGDMLDIEDAAEWPDFIAIHRKTEVELTAEEYNQLPQACRQDYEIAHFAIMRKRRTGEVIQQVYCNDMLYRRAKAMNA